MHSFEIHLFYFKLFQRNEFEDIINTFNKSERQVAPPPKSVLSEKCLATRMMMMTAVKVAAGLMTRSSARSTPQSGKRLRGPET